jgi:hypothetical protein
MGSHSHPFTVTTQQQCNLRSFLSARLTYADIPTLSIVERATYDESMFAERRRK